MAHHILVALEACYAGLAITYLDNPILDERRLKRFKQLSIIQRDTDPQARNILLAGIGDQKALWLNGGVFTKALIKALNGAADFNNDGLIQFEEIALFVNNDVTFFVNSQVGVQQNPAHYIYDRKGRGKVLFLKR